MRSLDNCLELDITRIPKKDIVKLDLEFYLRVKNRITYVYELSTRRLIMCCTWDRNTILNYLTRRLDDIKKAVADFCDRTKTMQQTESGEVWNILQQDISKIQE